MVLYFCEIAVDGSVCGVVCVLSCAGVGGGRADRLETSQHYSRERGSLDRSGQKPLKIGVKGFPDHCGQHSRHRGGDAVTSTAQQTAAPRPAGSAKEFEREHVLAQYSNQTSTTEER